MNLTPDGINGYKLRFEIVEFLSYVRLYPVIFALNLLFLRVQSDVMGALAT